MIEFLIGNERFEDRDFGNVLRAAGDLGVQKAVGEIYLGLDRKATEDEVRATARGWGGAANWATHLLLEELAAG